MRVEGKPYRTIWLGEDGETVCVIDQTRLPRRFEVASLRTLADAAHAIRSMVVRGAPLIGVTAAFGLWLAVREDSSEAGLAEAYDTLLATRPTAINLRWALDRARSVLLVREPAERAASALSLAQQIADEDVACSIAMGKHGAKALRAHFETLDREGPFQLLTHCNAGWLATVDWGTALAPVYTLHDAGVPIHVWVDETRPRNQGYLTAWELTQHGVPNTLIADNAGGLLMQQGKVDACIVGSDRTTLGGDVCNKIGTYLKALAAKAAEIPFYVALPSSSFDFSLISGDEIPIEEREPSELTDLPFRVANPAFDVTPRHLVSGLITERGVHEASESALRAAFPDLLPRK